MTEPTLQAGEAFGELWGKLLPNGEYEFHYTLGVDNCYDITVALLMGRSGMMHVYKVEFYNPIETHIVAADRVTVAVKRRTN